MGDRLSPDELPTRPGSGARPSPWPIDLAHIRPFRLGEVEVRPATREVIGSGRRELLEPLVMQVFVALASARGEILSRDDLIDACWGGRAITDDAINRVLSRLRALARTLESFQIETITKVGYRLVVNGGDELLEAAAWPVISTPQKSTRIGRRPLLIGGAAAAAVGAAVIAWRQPWRHRPLAEALDLFRRGEIAQRAGTEEQARQALSYYQRAVQVDPLYADAWGALALSHTHFLEGFGQAELASVPGSIRSAAQRALQLDPDNADAQLALILIKPEYRNWAQMEAELRDLTGRYPRHWLANTRLAVLLFEVGRLNEGIVFHQKVLSDIDAMLPVSQGYLVKALSFAGRTQEADAVLEEAGRKWPAHPALWYAKYTHLIFSGRPRSAIAFVMDPDARPTGVSQAHAEPLLTLARAIDMRQPSDVNVAIEDWRRMGLASVTRILPRSATVFAMLGRPDLTFESLERYYLNRGSFGPSTPIGPYTRRYTDLLFSQPMMSLRSDPRFASLLQRTGLEGYWRQTGTAPDYRRTA